MNVTELNIINKLGCMGYEVVFNGPEFKLNKDNESVLIIPIDRFMNIQSSFNLTKLPKVIKEYIENNELDEETLELLEEISKSI